MSMISPVMKPDSGETRKLTTWATSSGSQKRPTGIWASSSCCCDDQSLTLAFWHKSTNTSIGAGAVTDNLPGVVTGANAIGTIGSYAFDGLNGNPGGNRSSWGGWTYWITDGNPADAVAFGTDQTEVPESSGFEVVSHYGARLRITF